MTMKSMFRSFAGLLLLAGPAALRAETKVSQEMVTGAQVVDQNNPEAKFEEYREVPNGAFIDLYSMEVEGDKNDFSFTAKKVRQEDQSAAAKFNNGRLSLDVTYDQIPHNWSENAKTLYTEVAPGEFRLPDGMQATFQANPGTAAWQNIMASTFAGLAHAQELASRQDKTSVAMGYALSDKVQLGINLSMEKKNGHKLMAMPFGFSHAVEIAKPIDQTVYESNAQIGYMAGGMNLSLGYGASLYQNDINTVIWDSSRRSTDRLSSASGYSTGDQSSQGRMSMQPDNQAHTFSLAGGFDLPAKSRLDADISFTQMLQNDELLPYTINTALNASTNTVGIDAFDPATLPVKDANTKQTLWVQNYTLTNRSFKNVVVGFKARSEQLGNSSMEITFPGAARMDQGWSTAPISTDRFEYRKLAVGANADWDPSYRLGFTLDLTQEKATREHREYKETDERILTGKVRYRPAGWLSVRGRYVNADRKAKDLEIEDFEDASGTLIELPGLRRADIAARERNAGDVTVQMFRGPVSVGLLGALVHDHFKPGDGDMTGGNPANLDQQYGLLSNRNARAAVDLSWDATDRVGFFSFYEYEHVIGIQRSNLTNASPPVTQDAANDWSVKSTDRYDVAGLGFDVDVRSDLKVTLAYDLAHSRGATDFVDLGSALATKVTPPETKTTKQDYTVKGEYQVKKDLSFELGYLFERYDVTDYATENIPVVSGRLAGQTNLLLGDSLMDYKAHVVSAKVHYKW
ncbi:MAG TPA: MtrB/PioB family outer membrane beta-barrel protein [Elusimicrobiota bacterium]|nr:MtrB/PioB family outer membrane beta-barrel protein [Elusimicrobiota bacterium]